MEYKEIISVTGVSGLFQLVTSKSDGTIARNLTDKTTRFFPSRLHNITPLESIEVYTVTDNVRLHEVFEKMKENENVPLPDVKKAGNDEIKNYFKTIFPEIDEERVYVSDMKKMLKWFDLLKEHDLLDFESYKQQNNGAEATTEEEAPVTTEEKKPAKKSKAKKAVEEPVAGEGEEKPKKTARKKKTAEETETAEGEEKPAKKTARKKKEE